MKLDQDYQTLVLDDLAKADPLAHPVPVNLLTRLFISKLPPEKLHPNPQDEFCDPRVGPNFSIINNYEKLFNGRETILEEANMAEPLVVTKMSSGEYMLLNGHHRWFAAHKVHRKKIPVRITNVITEADIIDRVNSSAHTKCATFDLDEVLLTDGKETPVDKAYRFPVTLFYRRGLRRNVPGLITRLQSMGYDIWVYSGSWDTEKKLRGLFRAHHAQVDGVVNCTNANRSTQKVREAFKNKYKVILTVDNEGILRIDNTTGEYDQLTPEPGAGDWARSIYDTLDSYDKAHQA